MTATARPVAGPARSAAPGTRSPARALFRGRLESDWLLPYPAPDPAEAERVAGLTRVLGDYCAEHVDGRRLEQQGWIGDELVRDLAERELMGLGIPREYGGQGLSMTAYCRMFEALGYVDMAMALVLGIHQSIGTRGIVEFGTDEQRERFLPDLAAGRRLAAFALTEPEAGSDAYNIRSRAVRQADGSWRLNGRKRYIGNGDKGSVFVTFARTDEGAHVALIVEKGMAGFEAGPRYDMLGLRANDVRPLRFDDVRVPPENVLGEPGQGFRIARRVLENGRLTIAAGNTGCVKRLSDWTTEHVTTRRQFGRPLAEFGLVQDKLAWIATGLLGLEATTYLTAGLEDAGGFDLSLETAICKVTATDFVVGAANRALDLRGGAGYMRSEPYERILRDVRVFPIFEGANDVLRAWIALSGIKSAVEALQRDGDARPAVAPALRALAGQVERIGATVESLLATRGAALAERQLEQARLAEAVGAAYAQAAVRSLVDADDGDAERRARRELVAEAFCARAERRLHAALDGIDDNDDNRTMELAALAAAGGAYGHAFPEPRPGLPTEPAWLLLEGGRLK